MNDSILLTDPLSPSGEEEAIGIHSVSGASDNKRFKRIEDFMKITLWETCLSL